MLAELEKYGGKVVELGTAEVLSTGYQHMFRASIAEQHTGVLVGSSHDLKRVPEVLRRNRGFPNLHSII